MILAHVILDYKSNERNKTVLVLEWFIFSFNLLQKTDYAKS